MRKAPAITWRAATLTLAAFCAASGGFSIAADDVARPRDPTANVPSAIGAQTTTPQGAVTGAGNAQSPGLKELEYGRPGGLQQRAREREQALGATGESAGGSGGGPAERSSDSVR
jgi:hypothetical protein